MSLFYLYRRRGDFHPQRNHGKNLIPLFFLWIKTHLRQISDARGSFRGMYNKQIKLPQVRGKILSGKNSIRLWNCILSQELE